MSTSLLRIETKEVEVLTEGEALEFCGRDSEIFSMLLLECGLRPVKANRTRHQYLKCSLLLALKRLEASELLVEYRATSTESGLKWVPIREPNRR